MNPNNDPLKPHEHFQLALETHTALYEMLNGTARRAEWISLADAVNMVHALIMLHKIDAGATLTLVNLSIEGLISANECDDCFMRMHKAHANALCAVVSVFDQQIGRLSLGTIIAAKRMAALKFAEKDSPHVRVVYA